MESTLATLFKNHRASTSSSEHGMKLELFIANLQQASHTLEAYIRRVVDQLNMVYADNKGQVRTNLGRFKESYSYVIFLLRL